MSLRGRSSSGPPDEPRLAHTAREGHRCGRLLYRAGVDREERIAAFLARQIDLQKWLLNEWAPVEERAFGYGVREGWDAQAERRPPS